MSRNWQTQLINRLIANFRTTAPTNRHRTALETIVSRLHHDTEEPAPEGTAEARRTEDVLSIDRSTAQPAQPLHLPEIRCRYLKTVNKLPDIPTKPEWAPPERTPDWKDYLYHIWPVPVSCLFPFFTQRLDSLRCT